MSEKRASLEVIAPTVDEAVTRGLADLGLSQDAVEVEVLDAGSRGLFGLGFRQARVRLTIRAVLQDTPIPSQPAPVAPLADEPQAVQAEEAEEFEDAGDGGFDEPETEPEPEPAPMQILTGVPETDEVLRAARETVEELLAKMKIQAHVTARMGEPEDARDRAAVWVDVRGDDLSILIGPKAETLNALQYIAGLIVSKEVGRSVPLVVDVEGFRMRRSQQIRQLARRMAEQAVRTGRRQVMEPMPASERRIIHIELRNNPNVITESVGEEPRRKVTIAPKNA